jgi:hypothetical protein
VRQANSTIKPSTGCTSAPPPDCPHAHSTVATDECSDWCPSLSPQLDLRAEGEHLHIEHPWGMIYRPCYAKRGKVCQALVRPLLDESPLYAGARLPWSNETIRLTYAAKYRTKLCRKPLTSFQVNPQPIGHAMSFLAHLVCSKVSVTAP